MHGHNYQAEVDIRGELSENGLVIDFKMAKPIVRELCDELDEHFLLPAEHPELKWRETDDGHLEWYRDCRHCAPRDEVILMPLDNSSAENFATWMGRELQQRLTERFGRAKVAYLRVMISETSGQHGVYEWLDSDE